MYYFPNVDPTYIFKRKGTSDDPFIPIIDENNVRSGAIVLKEIPHFEERVKASVDGKYLTEVETDDLNPDEFRVDYTTGVAYFHYSLNGKLVKLEYLGTGYVSFPASRIWMIGDSDDPVKSLEEALDRVDEGIAVLDSMSDFRFQGEYQDTSEYKKWNFVFYNNKTYVALETVSGEKPDESDKWRLVSSGVGFAGVYQEDTIYRVGDIVSDTQLKNIYFSKKDNNSDPVDNQDSWELMLTLDDIIEGVSEKLDDLDNFIQTIEDAEDNREQNELNRQQEFENLLLDIQSLTDIIQAEEEVRNLNEAQRISSEQLRVSAEMSREEQESIRQNNENNRVLAEKAREQLFQELNLNLQQAINDAINSVNSANEALESMKAEIIDALNSFENSRDMIHAELSRIVNFRYVGEFDEDREYVQENIVTYGGRAYIALRDTQGNDVSNEEYWAVFSEKGLDSTAISIEGVFPDESGEIHLDQLDIVRQSTFDDFVNETNLKIGDLSNLRTARKDSIVDAINELKNRIDELIDLIS